MSKTLSTEARYHAKRLMPLCGGKIVSIIVDENDPGEIYCGFIVEMRNGKKYEIIAARDPEFNGAGHLSVMTEDS